jgi:hypothetical protein
MRIHRDIPGAHTVSVYLDGEKLTRCLMADDEEGWAACMFEDAKGHAVMFEAVDGEGHWQNGAEPITEIRRGTVTFAFDPPEGRQWVEQGLAKVAEARRRYYEDLR